jgi:hypothetical protein
MLNDHQSPWRALQSGLPGHCRPRSRSGFELVQFAEQAPDGVPSASVPQNTATECLHLVKVTVPAARGCAVGRRAVTLTITVAVQRFDVAQMLPARSCPVRNTGRHREQV